MRFLEFLFSIRMRRYYEKYYRRDEWRYGEPDMVVGSSSMAEYYQTVTPVCTMFLTGFSILIAIFIGVFLIMNPLKTAEEIQIFQGILLIFFCFVLGIQVLKIMELMFLHNGYCLYPNFILVRKIGRASREIPYEEVREVLQHRKIRKRAGCFRIPMPRGTMKITCGHSEDDRIDLVISYLNKYGKMNLPMPTWEDKVRVRRSGLLPIINKTNLFLWIMDLLIIFVVFISGEEEGTFLQIYFPSNMEDFAKDHFMLWLAAMGYIFVVFVTLDDLFFRFLRLIGVIPKEPMIKKVKDLHKK